MDGYCMLLSTRFIIREQNDIKVQTGDLVFGHLVPSWCKLALLEEVCYWSQALNA